MARARPLPAQPAQQPAISRAPAECHGLAVVEKGAPMPAMRE
ncbi:MAG: hypothetical protein ACOYNY_20325 [Caldilineaceae bacterium]